METRKVAVWDVEPTAIDWPYVRSLICVESSRGTKDEPKKPEKRYFLSSIEKTAMTPEDWLALIRGHWAGVEIRNHWRKDHCWREDHTRSRNPNIVGALALLRNTLLAIVADHIDSYGSMTAFIEACQHRPAFALRQLRSKS